MDVCTVFYMIVCRQTNHILHKTTTVEGDYAFVMQNLLYSVSLICTNLMFSKLNISKFMLNLKWQVQIAEFLCKKIIYVLT